VADIVIVPMQDILNLDGSCRMNRPASTTGNWLWRIEQTAYCKSIQNQLYNYTKIYNR
ncbi:4-alpha-glucanotransferase, partial [Sphingobacterium sp.]|uniref:4-alpha-glucanotransferase n=1 Tax=Sphingobacterium sp. TaxID=341027 RepID=UPI0039174CD0